MRLQFIHKLFCSSQDKRVTNVQVAPKTNECQSQDKRRCISYTDAVAIPRQKNDKRADTRAGGSPIYSELRSVTGLLGSRSKQDFAAQHVRRAKKRHRFPVRIRGLLGTLLGALGALVAPNCPAQPSPSLRCFHPCHGVCRPADARDHARIQ